jgi:hypothetical protein
MIGRCFDPFDGSFSEPVERLITKSPAFNKPSEDGFHILAVEIQSGLPTE